MFTAFHAALCRNFNTRFLDDVKGRGKGHYMSGCRLALVSSIIIFKIFAAISMMRLKSLLLTWYVPSTSRVGDQHKGGFLYYMAIGELEDVLLKCYVQRQAFSRTVAGPLCKKQVQKLCSCFFSSTQCCARGFKRKKNICCLVHGLLHCQPETASSSLPAVYACRNMWKTESVTCSYICSPVII